MQRYVLGGAAESVRLRGAKRAHVIQPKTAAEAVTFHEEELQAVAQPQRLKRGSLERDDEAMEWMVRRLKWSHYLTNRTQRSKKKKEKHHH